MQANIQHSIMQGTSDGIVVTDQNGLIIDFNPAAERLFGVTKARIIGHSINSLMPAVEAQQHDNYMQNYLQTGVRSTPDSGREVQAKHKDGFEFPIHLSIRKVEHDDKIYFVGICHALSKQHALQKDKTESEN